MQKHYVHVVKLYYNGSLKTEDYVPLDPSELNNKEINDGDLIVNNN
jgi:hypothetical protein